ncbi:MAG TPA: YicC/YloC family endoribonuclease [Bacillota bacterium]|nr:YicC/YloC family endoribonuclease [Bacillota bacterium]
MVRSMTGYGHDTLRMEQAIITVEIRTVNHRFFDFHVKAPHTLLFLEDKIKRLVQSYIERGRVDVYINIEGSSFTQKSLQADWDLIDQYVHLLKNVQERYDLNKVLSQTIIPEIPDLITVEEYEETPHELTDQIMQSIERACQQVIMMRQEEGRFLMADIKKRMKSIRNMLLLVEGRRKYVIQEYRERIEERLVDYLGDSASVDWTRMHQEIALLAEKGDITEETTRLHSHINHFVETIDEGGVIGRKLDFIVQEMQRETNTIGSKSIDCKIGEWTVQLKSDMEKIKEQVQNIE